MFGQKLTVAEVFGNLPQVTEDQITASFASKLEGKLPKNGDEGTVHLNVEHAIAGAFLLHKLGIPVTRHVSKTGATLVVWATDLEKIKD